MTSSSALVGALLGTLLLVSSLCRVPLRLLLCPANAMLRAFGNTFWDAMRSNGLGHHPHDIPMGVENRLLPALRSRPWMPACMLGHCLAPQTHMRTAGCPATTARFSDVPRTIQASTSGDCTAEQPCQPCPAAWPGAWLPCQLPWLQPCWPSPPRSACQPSSCIAALSRKGCLNPKPLEALCDQQCLWARRA